MTSNDRLALIRAAVARDGSNLEDAYADRAWLLSYVDRLRRALSPRRDETTVEWGERARAAIEPAPVQTEVCPVCRTVHDKPLCPAPETKAPHFFHNDAPCRHCGKDASEHAVNMQCIGPAVKTSAPRAIERWDLTDGSEMRSSATTQHTGTWVRYDDIKHLLSAPEPTVCPWCESREQHTDPRGTCARCGIPWRRADFLPGVDDKALEELRSRQAVNRESTHD